MQRQSEGSAWVRSTRGRCVVQYVRGTKVQNASYQRCEHPGFRRGSAGAQEKVWRGSGGGLQGLRRRRLEGLRRGFGGRSGVGLHLGQAPLDRCGRLAWSPRPRPHPHPRLNLGTTKETPTLN
eukprot:1191665-Prorocentrum_minimum.AAC.1